MRGPKFEQNAADMDGEATAAMALKYPQTVVGIKTAHFEGPEWIAVEQAVIAGTKANIPVMVDFGVDRPITPALRSFDQQAPPRRHLHAHVLGASA